MTDFLRKTPVIWTLFVLMIVSGAGFGYFNNDVGGVYLDTSSSTVQSREIIAAMTDQQRDRHFWVTTTLDTAFPLAYGGFFAAMALRYFDGLGGAIAMPALATIIVDLAENTVQALALSRTVDLLGTKEWLTPLKYGLFFLSAAIAFAALMIAIINLLRRKPA